jgi:MOSC domain-containing protein YiiM
MRKVVQSERVPQSGDSGVLVQINRSKGGVPKREVPPPVMLSAEGIEGDWQRDRRYHGGPDRAVLMIASEVLDELKSKHYPVYPGSLGENLTVTGLDPAHWRPGQRYRIGDDAEIELTTLRAPCAQIQIYGDNIGTELYDRKCRAGDFSSPRWAKGGYYARVTRSGLVNKGAAVRLVSDVA